MTKKYNCPRCGFQTDHKNNFRKHIFRKYSCKVILNDVDIKTIQNDFKLNKVQQYPHLYPHLSSFISSCHEDKNGLKIHKCKFCEKDFSSYKNKWRHEKNNCPMNKLVESKNICQEIDILKQKISNLENQKMNVNTKINSDNTIIVNNFGSENLDYISNNMMKKLLKQGPKSIPYLIKQIHFNPDHPENHNIRIKNKKLKYAEVKEDNKWKYKHKKAVLDDLVDFGYVTLEEFKENNETEMDDLLVKGFKRLMTSYVSNKEKIIDQVELEVMNGMNEIKV